MLLFNKGLQHLALKSRALSTHVAMQAAQRMPLSQNAIQMRTFMTNMNMMTQQRNSLMMMQQQRFAFSAAANKAPVQIKVNKNTVTDPVAALEQ